MFKKNSVDLLKDPITPLLVKLSLPVMLSGLLRTSYNFTDMIFASRLGGVQVASVAIVAPLFMMFQALGIGLANGGVSVIAKALGQGDRHKAATYAVQLRKIILVLAAAFSLFGILLTPLILSSMGFEGELYRQSLIYSQILFFSIPFTLIVQLYMALYKSQGKMGISTTMALIGVIGNIILNYIFIIVFENGIAGLAFATLLTLVLQSIIIIWDYHRREQSFNLTLNLFKGGVDLKVWKKLLKIGLPLGFSLGSSQFGFFLLTSIIEPFGYQVVAGFAIGNQINSLLFSPTVGIGQALVPLVAQNWGAKAQSRIREIIKKGMTFSFLFGLGGAVILQLLIKPLGGFLSHGDEVIMNHVRHYMGLVSWTVIAWAIFQSLAGIFSGFQKTMITMLINLIRLWGLRIPGVLLFSAYLPSIAEYGVWYTMFVSNIVTALAAVIIYFVFIPGKLSGDLKHP